MMGMMQPVLKCLRRRCRFISVGAASAAIFAARFSRLKPLPRVVLLAPLLLWGQTVFADGSTPLYSTIQGCFDRTIKGVGLYADGSGSLTVNAPGPVIDAYIEWGGVEDSTPDTIGTSTLTINGVQVVGNLPPEGESDGWGSDHYYTWNANIGPNGYNIINSSGNINVAISDWDGAGSNAYYWQSTWGATITVIYSTGNCAEQNQLQHFTGADFYYRDSYSAELLVFNVPNLPEDHTASVVFSHGGTDSSQSGDYCRGGALWMSAGSGAPPDPVNTELYDTAANSAGYGLHQSNGVIVDGVEIINDPFTSASLPCVLTRNPSPDVAYEAGHSYPTGAASAPYYAISNTPAAGGDLGPQWGVLEVEVNIPANSDWIAFQLESEADQSGESGAWMGGAGISIKSVVPNKTTLEVLKVLEDAPASYDSKFTVLVSCNDGTTATLLLDAGVAQTVDDIDIGSNCSVSEPALPDPPSAYSWSATSPTMTPASVDVQALEGGTINTQTASLDIVSNDASDPIFSIALTATTSAQTNPNKITVTNTLVAASTASIKIIKDALISPDSPQDFAFTASGLAPGSFVLDDDADATLSNQQLYTSLAPGNYRVSESATTDWSLNNVRCEGGADSTFVVDSTGVDISLAAGDDVVCTFSNAGACPDDLPYILNVSEVGNSNGDSNGSNDLSSVCVEIFGTEADLTITKNLQGLPDTINPPTTPYTFSVSCPGFSLSAGDSSFGLVHGETHTIYDIPVDTNCTVTEQTPLPALGTGISYGTVMYQPAQTVTIVPGGVDMVVVNPAEYVDLAVTKTANKPTTVSGDILVYTITLTNLGTVQAVNAYAYDTLPDEVTFISSNAASTGTSYNPATGRWDVGNLAADSSIVLELTVEVN